jgi:hypothetical protein
MELAITADDLLLSDTAAYRISSRLREKRTYGALTFYGKSPLDPPVHDSIDLWPVSQAIQYLNKVARHQEYILANAATITQPLFADALQVSADRNSTVKVRHAGIESVWSASDFNDWLAVRTEYFDKHLSKYGDALAVMGNVLSFIDHTRRPNPSDSLLINAYNEAWRDRFVYTISRTSGATHRLHVYRSQASVDKSAFQVGDIHAMLVAHLIVDKSKPSASDINKYRMQMLSQQARSEHWDRKHASIESFRKYWTEMKQRIAVNVDTNEARESFASVPLLPEGTKSSRTWGIEIETVQANHCTRPPGWDRRGDGSLESIGGGGACSYDYCDCDCDDCSDGDHNECYDGDDDQGCAEFVSPILSHFNSAGLLSLANSIGDRECNDSPGIHVHVGASDLSPVDVSRLTRIYSIVSPFLWELTYRNVTGYCKDISPDNIAHWLASVRGFDKLSLGSDLSYTQRIAGDQPDDRYHDLNLQALNAHGTIEFRAMGPHYDYKHLVRWAWLCRELVNLSKLAIPDEKWKACKSMADVLNIVYEYGSETSDSVMSPLVEATSMYFPAESLDEDE